MTDIPPSATIPGQTTYRNNVFPYVILSPKDGISKEETQEWFLSHKDEIEDLKNKHGAILFRGFPVSSAAQFDELVNSLGYEPFPYDFGNAPRFKVVGNVYTSTEVPPQYPLNLHHEMVYRPTVPNRIFFYCDVAPKEDGETPLCDSNFVYEHLLEHKKEFVEKVTALGCRYHKYFHDKNVPGAPSTSKSWQDTYGTEDKQEIEEITKKLNNTFTWLPNGGLERITQPIKAIRHHPVTNLPTWFNNIHFSHPAACYTTKELLTSFVTFGNGEEINPEDAVYVNEFIWKNAVKFKWEVGDVLYVDNMAVLHGRNKFTPPRKVYISMLQ